MTIFAFLTGSIALVIQGGMRYMRLGYAHQDAQRQILLAMRHITSDLNSSTPMQITPMPPWETDLSWIIFLSPHPPAPDTDWLYDGNELLYHDWIAYYHDVDTRELRRAHLPIDSGPLPSFAADTPPDLDDFLPPQSDAETKVVARQVTEFAISEGASERQVRVRLSVQVDTGSEQDTTISSQTLVTLPNR